ncbi:cytidylyltransferase [Synechococcus phage B3]|nr:cytidylyltransferase [Synechococcus phage B3]QGT54921.1 cytidylyltransferase [Synechococcus phage B23]
MKKYLEFIIEARGSRAAEKAAQFNLVSDNHGMWVDRSGRPVAKTVKGDLVFLRKKSPKPQKVETPKSPPKPAKRQDPPLQKRVSAERQVNPPKEEPGAPEIDPQNTLTVVFGRFNPPTIGHERLIKKANEIAQGKDLKIYPSRMYGDPLNPLDPPTKIFYMRKAFPKFADNIINDDDMKSIFDVLVSAEESGYNSVNIVTGIKRKAEIDRLSNQYNGEIYNLSSINVIPLDSEDPDLENSPNPTSASKLRKNAVEDNFFDFQKGLPKNLDDKQQKSLFFAVQRALEGELQNESWKFAPKLSFNPLKEAYYQEKIFKTGDVVENLNTGLTGKIIRRGPNYVICVNEKYNIMFKSWILDIREWTEVSGVPANQREVGTDALRDYVMKLTKTDVISNFINKRKKKLNNKKIPI